MRSQCIDQACPLAQPPCATTADTSSYTGVPNQAVWGINFDAGDNQLVKPDGTYIGPQ
jgi:hypothetical protein